MPVLLSAALFAWFLTFLGPVSRGETLRWSLDWAPSLGVSLSFYIDALSLTFVLLISGIGTLVMLYSDSYLRGDAHFGRFALYLTSFMFSMLGLVAADNLIAVFVFWELTTITSYLLIGYSHDQADSRRSALQALLVTGLGGLAMLAGFILLGTAAGTFELSQILTRGDIIRDHSWYPAILILVLAGAFTKSAQVPFHFWLPNAMAAPTPVSAFLHSATMVKGGVYLMARLHPTLSGTDAWLWSLTIAGGVTAVFASLQAMRQTDMKQVLAYTTLMALGTLTLFLASDSAYAVTAFAVFLVTHSLYKAALFLMAGCVDHGTGTRDLRRLGGLARAMPFSALAAALAALSMAGLPPTIGFIAKELGYAGGLEAASWPAFVIGAALIAKALMFAIAAIVAIGPFWRAGGKMPHDPHEADWQMLAGPLLLGLLGLGAGIFPQVLEHYVTAPMALAFLGEMEKGKELHLWAGVNLPFLLSLATFALGLAFYLGRAPLRRILDATVGALPNLDALWDDVLDGLKGLANWQTNVLQTGKLRRYLVVIFTSYAGIMAVTLWLKAAVVIDLDFSDLILKQWMVIGLIVTGAAIVTVTRSRLASIAALGTVGIGVALVFIIYSAPDVAITQLLIETLNMVLVSVALLRMPFLDPQDAHDHRPKDAVLALAVGGVVGTVLLAVVNVPIDLRLTRFFEQMSYPEAHGRNIVNVILVDFRAMDTFGEIAVVVVAALAAYALLRTTGKGSRA